MKIHKLLLYSAVVAGALASCKNKEDLYTLNVPKTVDVVSGADIAFKAIGGEGDIEVAPVEGGQLSATTGVSWCHLTVQGNKIHVVVDEYSGIESRYAKVEMKAGDATGTTIVHQYGVIVRTFQPKNVAVKNNAQDVTFFYDANETMIQASTDADWITILPESDSLRLRVAANPDKEYREANISWNIGDVKGTFVLVQFDLADAGLLGEWKWNSVQATNNRALAMDAVLREEGDGYVLDLSYSTSSSQLEISIPGVILNRNVLEVPLGGQVGTYETRTASYLAFLLLAPGTGRIAYADGITTGTFGFTLEKGEDDTWTAIPSAAAYQSQYLRFEMWPNETHSGTSSSGLVLRDIKMEKI